MGAYQSRSGDNESQQDREAADKKSGAGYPVGERMGQGTPSPSAHAIEPITMRVPDACRYTGISRSTLYVLIAAGEIEIIKLGNSTLVLTESLKALVAKRRCPIADRPVRIGT
ncbi:helix-turn-helix domain-containing protein [Blastomonas sp. UPD001]|uniref:helix-turn-helix domain-containing protein n=1 Tax=Blastomonas sp. UPD001 TaxID=2217673 RepID=UPI00336C2FCF